MTKRLLTTLLLLIVSLSMASGVSAGKATGGMALTFSSFSGQVKYTRFADCYLTDDIVTKVYQGSLSPGQSFSAYLDLCYSDQYTTAPGYVDEQTDEDFALYVAAAGDVAPTLTLIRRGYPDRPLPVTVIPGRPLTTWTGCAYSTYWITYDTNNMTQYGGARLLVSLSNPSSKAIRNVTLRLNLNLSGFVGNGC